MKGVPSEGPVDDGTAVDTDELSQPADNVTVTHTDVDNAASDDEKLPAGFPRDIPVETTEINESYTASYDDNGAVQHSFSYRSQSSVEAKFSEYQTYMNEAGYTIEGSNTESERIASITGSKDGDTLSVVISQQPENTMVQVSYLQRPDSTEDQS